MTAIVVSGLVKSYRSGPAVAGVSFEVRTGEVVAVLGPNGAGKTTTVEILEGLRRRDGGQVRVLGQDPERAGRPWRAQIGLVPQSTSLEPELTVVEALRLYAGLYPAPRRVDDTLDLAGLTGQADTRIGALSGGQQRRVDLALGIVGNPRLLFLDEPTTGFDPSARRQAWRSIRALCAASGMTVLLTTHYLAEAASLADRVIVMSRGRIVADAPPADLVSATRTTPALIRWPMPPGTRPADLPPALAAAAELTDGWAALPTTDLTTTLSMLVDWARAHGQSLDRLSVSQPDLEDAYLALTEPPTDEPTDSHASIPGGAHVQ